MHRPIRVSTPVGFLVVALSVGLVCNFDAGLACPPQSPAENPVQSGLHITVLEGEDGVNILKTRMAVKPVVEVRDKNHLPVSGVTVTFLAPDSGARVAFAHGSNTFMTTTDANGRAAVSSSRPLGRGAFKIKVTADLHGQIISASITQTNYLTVAAATAAGAGTVAGAGAGAGAATAGALSGTVIGAIVAGAAAAAVGIAVAATRGKTPTGTIGSAGSPTMGPSH